MNKQSKYDRDVIMGKMRRKGLKIKYQKGKGSISHFDCPLRVNLGIRFLGYLDFLGVPAVKQKPSKRRIKEKKREVQTYFPPNKIWRFGWFPNREDAEAWVASPKLREDIDVTKVEVYQTEHLDYRGVLEGNLK